MNYPKLLLLTIGVMLGSIIFASPIEDFYNALYNTTSIEEVPPALNAFLDAETDPEQIKYVIDFLNGQSEDWVDDFFADYRISSYRDFGSVAATILHNSDALSSLRQARMQIAYDPGNIQAYKLLYIKHLDLMPTAEDEVGWFEWNQRIDEDKAYLGRMAKLGPDESLYHYARLITGVASDDKALALSGLRGILAQKGILSESIKMDYILPDPIYRELVGIYLKEVEAAFGDLSDIQPVNSMAISLARFHALDENWPAIIDVFGSSNPFTELGVVKINLLRAYEAQHMYPELYECLTGEGLQRAIEIIDWWRIYDPGFYLEQFLAGIAERHPNDPIVQAVQVDENDSPIRKLEDSKLFADAHPDEIFGYQSIYEAYNEIFAEEVFSPFSDEPLSMQFVDDLSYWDRYNQLDPERANVDILNMAQSLLIAESYRAVIDLEALREAWANDRNMSLMVVVAWYQMSDYDAMFAKLGMMVTKGLLSYSDVQSLGQSEPGLTEMEGWSALVNLAEAANNQSTEEPKQER